jgi:hypothetical protein
MSPLGVQFELDFSVDGLAAASPSERPRAAYRAVMPGYLRRWRSPFAPAARLDAFDGRDQGPRVAIVNETLSKRYFGAANP